MYIGGAGGGLSMPGPEALLDGGCSARTTGSSAKCVHNAAAGLAAGTDLNCGQPWGYTSIIDAIKQVRKSFFAFSKRFSFDGLSRQTSD